LRGVAVISSLFPVMWFSGKRKGTIVDAGQ
jgi:hypothetical protein